MPPVVDDVADVDGLLVRSRPADALQGVLHRHVGLQIHKLRGHDASGGVLGVFQDLVDALAHFRVTVAQDALHHPGGHLLHDIRRVVQVELVQDLLQLRVGEAVNQKLLVIAVQLHENLRRQLLGQQAEHHRHLLVQILAEGGDVRRLHGQQQIPKLRVAFSAEQLLDFFQQLRSLVLQFKHAGTSSPHS